MDEGGGGWLKGELSAAAHCWVSAVTKVVGETRFDSDSVVMSACH